MTLQLDDTGDLVAKWRHVMAAMFAGYTKTLGPLDPGSVFGARAQAWQQEYERRTGQPVDGIVSDADLAALKIVVPHRPIWFYSAPGSGAPWSIGPMFDVGEWARQVLNINHQPVGYPIGGYMGLMGGDPSNSYIDIITDLDRELERLLDLNPDVQAAMAGRAADPHAPVPLELWFGAYSQSADGIKCAVNRLFGDGTGPTAEGPPTGQPGKYAVLRDRINGLLLVGDPARQPGQTKVGNTPVGWGISRKIFPAWINALTWSITNETPTPDFYAACDDEIRPLFYEWFVKAKSSLGFMVYCGQIIIPALLGLVTPFLGGGSGGGGLLGGLLGGLGGTGGGGLTNVLAAPVLAGAAGMPVGAVSSLLGAVTGSNEAPDPKLIQFLSVQGILTNLPGLLKLLADLPGIAVHGDYNAPKPEFGGRNGVQVACDVMAAFRR